MSSKTFDLTKMTVEDLFRAKKERRQRLANLPFQEKIEIVKKLQAVARTIRASRRKVRRTMTNEKNVFASFLEVLRDFAGEPVKEWDVVEEWYVNRALTPPAVPYDKRPDVICVTSSGRKIGVELKSWLNEEQIAEARSRPDHQWVQSPTPVGFYGDEMLETLSKSLVAHTGDARYKDLGKLIGLDEVYLLVHYDFKSFAYNTPFDAPGFGFKEAAESASRVLGGDGGYFDRIFLFHFLWGEEKAYRIL
ncbi:MAG TPA: hypothetical protein VK582_18825 [Pyrinomonadaceae bacterium]|nr:hypothetical protein [Pyrinomonadaceae bacterium]